MFLIYLRVSIHEISQERVYVINANLDLRSDSGGFQGFVQKQIAELKSGPNMTMIKTYIIGPMKSQSYQVKKAVLE